LFNYREKFCKTYDVTRQRGKQPLQFQPEHRRGGRTL